jgi:hypothetical protein
MKSSQAVSHVRMELFCNILEVATVSMMRDWPLASIPDDGGCFKVESHLGLIVGLCGEAQETKLCLKHF